MNLTVRKAVKSDVEFLLQSILLRNGNPSKNLAEGTSLTKADLLSHGKYEDDDADCGTKYFRAMVAEDCTRLGILVYYFHYSTWQGKVIYLRDIFCVPDRFEQVAKALLRSLAEEAKKDDCKRICFDSSQLDGDVFSLLVQLGAIDLTKKEGWQNFYFDIDATNALSKEGPNKKLECENIVIRKGRKEDCKSISGHIMELAVFENYPEGPQLSVEDLIRDGFELREPLYYSFVVEHWDDTLKCHRNIGYALYFQTYDLKRGRTLHLEDFYVTPEFRGRGIGKMLFAQIGQEVIQSEFSGFTLQCLDWNAKALAFYEKRGGVNLTLKFKETHLRFLEEGITRLSDL